MDNVIVKISKEHFRKMIKIQEQQEFNNLYEVIDYLLFVEGEL